jgi:hypothetical protein
MKYYQFFCKKWQFYFLACLYIILVHPNKFLLFVSPETLSVIIGEFKNAGKQHWQY